MKFRQHFLLLVYHFLIFSEFTHKVICSKELDTFQDALNEARSHLAWIQETVTDNTDDYEDDVGHRHRRHSSINDLLEQFSELDEESIYNNLEGGDAWYRDFRTKECKHGYCQDGSTSLFEKAGTSSYSSAKKSKLKHRRIETDYYEEYDDENDFNADDNNSKFADDQTDSRKNDLSHEANYKLSKIEQDASEKKIRANNSLFQSGWNSKRSVETSKTNKDKTDDIPEEQPKTITEVTTSRKKRSVNEDSSELSFDNFDYDAIDVGDKDIATDDDNRPYKKKSVFDFYDIARSLGEERFDNLKQKNSKLLDFENQHFDNIHLMDQPPKDDLCESKEPKIDKDLILSLSDEIVNNPTFAKLETLLKGSTDCEPDAVGAHSNATKSKHKNKTTKHPKTTKKPKSKTTKKPTTTNTTVATMTTVKPTAVPKQPNTLVPPPKTMDEKDLKKIKINLQMSLNAAVPKNSSVANQTFQRENKIVFNRKDGKVAGRKVDRDRRGIIFPFLSSYEKRRANDDISQSIRDENNNEFSFDEIITGKLTGQMVKTILALVKTTPELKCLGPCLFNNNNRPPSSKQVKNFYAIRNHENESEMHRTEIMLQKTMETINSIIEQQVRSRTCIPLRPDLRDFYEIILSTHALNEKNRGKRTLDPMDFSKAIRQIDGNKITSKSRVVKKLLGQYENLPIEEQIEMQPIKETLLMDLVYLRKLQTDQDQMQKRKKRDFSDEKENLQIAAAQSSNAESDERSSNYLKLLKASELFRQGGEDV